MQFLSRLIILSLLATIMACTDGHIRAKREGLIPTKDFTVKSMGFQKEEERPYSPQEL